MHIEKTFRTDLTRCYSAGCTYIDGKAKLLLSSELEGPTRLVDAETLAMETVCEGPGGVMSMIPIPGKNGDFLMVQRFYPVFQSKEAGIAWCRPTADGWETREILKLPYLHRFDLFAVGDTVWFLGATLCTSKTEVDDWSDPGKLWVGILPKTPEETMEVYPIREGLLKNHGYYRWNWQGEDAGFVTCNSGVYVVRPPRAGETDWRIDHILERPISDVAVLDIDGDGEDELLLLEGFHGDEITINKKIDGEYKVIWEYKEKPIKMVHVAWGGLLRGVPTFICGTRKLDGGLFMVRYNKKTGGFETTEIEGDTGPANVCVVLGKDKDLILAANHRIGEGAVYTVTD